MSENTTSGQSDQSQKSVVQTTFKYSGLTGQIIGCAMRVHSALGNGFQEVIYQRALEIEMTDSGLDFSREHEMPVYYKQQQIGTRRVDFFCRRSGFCRV